MSGKIDNKHSGVQDLVLEEEKIKENDPENQKISDSESGDAKPSEEQSENCIKNENPTDGSPFCDVCNIKVTSSKILQRHFEGKRHKARAERRGKTFYCEICDIKANSEAQLNIHLTSSKHKAKIARNEYKEFTDYSKTSAGIYVLIFCAMCLSLNLVIMLKVGF